ncbi:MAG: TMEM165/GDT1 family protein [Acidimicrobiales bacterium]
MNFVILATTFVLVIPAELPDKTFISVMVLSSRHRPLPVWLGASVALVLQAAIAVVAGGLLALLPHTVVESVIAALFVAGAAYLIFVPEKREEDEGQLLADELDPGAPPAPASSRRIALTTFSIVALAEFGDITQVLIANLTARFKAPVPVFVGASLAFVLISGIGVLGGRAIIRVIPLQTVRRISGLALLGLGIYTIVTLL